MNMNTLSQLDVAGKTILVRVDFNVPLDDDRQVTDPTRIEAAKPTIEYLRHHGAKVVLMSHFGRPGGKVKEDLRFSVVVPTINKVLGVEVQYMKDTVGVQIKEAINQMQAGQVMMLENVRFHPGEKSNDPAFAQELADLADCYVNDAFGAAHRAHASTAGVAALLPHAAGLLMEREVTELSKVLDSPEHPVAAIIGGSKISTKMALIENILPKVDYILLGGALANTMLLAQDHNVGKSLVEEELTDTVKGIMNNKLRLPIDLVVAKEISESADYRVVAVGGVDDDDYALDIGPDTVKLYKEILAECKTVLWNGPMGVFEIESFAMGTYHLARGVAQAESYSVIGGGETVSAVTKVGLEEDISFISTGGGAMLEFLEGKELPGIIALS